MKKFLKEFCKDKFNTVVVILELLISIFSVVSGYYNNALTAMLFAAMFILSRVQEMQYDRLRRYTDELEKLLVSLTLSCKLDQTKKEVVCGETQNK